MGRIYNYNIKGKTKTNKFKFKFLSVYTLHIDISLNISDTDTCLNIIFIDLTQILISDRKSNPLKFYFSHLIIAILKEFHMKSFRRLHELSLAY